MQVVWLDEAKLMLKEAISYGRLAFGEKATIRFVDEIQKNNERLSSFPGLGKIEPLLRNLKREYRSLVVHRNYKIIYFIDSDRIFIATLWNTHCNPGKLRSRIKEMG